MFFLPFDSLNVLSLGGQSGNIQFCLQQYYSVRVVFLFVVVGAKELVQGWTESPVVIFCTGRIL
jgi:hypothetical protein